MKKSEHDRFAGIFSLVDVVSDYENTFFWRSEKEAIKDFKKDFKKEIEDFGRKDVMAYVNLTLGYWYAEHGYRKRIVVKDFPNIVGDIFTIGIFDATEDSQGNYKELSDAIAIAEKNWSLMTKLEKKRREIKVCVGRFDHRGYIDTKDTTLDILWSSKDKD